MRGVEEPAPGRWRIACDRDVRAEAAAEVVAAGGRLKQLSLDQPSLETIYTRYFQNDERGGRAMRREGSPWQGLGVVTLKELSDHLTSARMRVLEWLVVLVALAAVYARHPANSRRDGARTRSCSCGCSPPRAIRCRPSCRSWVSWCR